MSSSLDEFERLMALLDGKPAPQRAGEANLHKDAATLRAELAQLYNANQDSGWRPMSQPPRRGEVVLAFVITTDGRPLQLIARYIEDRIWYTEPVHFADARSIQPTHWQPLPPPPQEAQND